jgi:predicted TPR repeat methyltransferase
MSHNERGVCLTGIVGAAPNNAIVMKSERAEIESIKTGTTDPDLSAAGFEARYRGGTDSQALEDGAYELNRYRAIISSLRMAAYGNVYEPGCSIGLMTQQLGSMAKRVIACDFAPSAIEQVKLRCADQTNVEVICADIRTFVPNAPLDLIIFSDIGYYFSENELPRIAAQLACYLVTDGEFMAAHRFAEQPHHVLDANRVHETLAAHLPLCPFRAEQHSGFRLDSWIKS